MAGRPSSQRIAPTSTYRPKTDRKSTRLNSSHSQISYAVFCLKKKKNISSSRVIKAPESGPDSDLNAEFLQRFFGDDCSCQFGVPPELRERSLELAMIVNAHG